MPNAESVVQVPSRSGSPHGVFPTAAGFPPGLPGDALAPAGACAAAVAPTIVNAETASKAPRRTRNSVVIARSLLGSGRSNRTIENLCGSEFIREAPRRVDRRHRANLPPTNATCKTPTPPPTPELASWRESRRSDEPLQRG